MKDLYLKFSECNGVCTDTRMITADCIFFALKGENFNGNEFAAEALQKGAKYAVIDDEKYFVANQTVLVDDVLTTLQQLAHYHRKQFHIPVIGITGSNGKTTSKELIAAVLQKKYSLLYTKGNLNNHIGVPLTLLQLHKEHEIAIIEMGANKPGDIQELCEIADPDFGIITNIGKAHLEGFGGFEGVLKTKTELYRWIAQMGQHLFVNADNEILKNAIPKGLSYSSYGAGGEVKGHILKLDPFIHFQWEVDQYKSRSLSTQLVGAYNLDNFLAAACIGHYFGVENDSISDALSSYSPNNNRSQVKRTERNLLIIDCYNANPTSMDSALSSFAAIDHPNKWVILGDMRELGDSEMEEHQVIINRVQNENLQSIFVGPVFAALLKHRENVFEKVSDLSNSSLKEIREAIVLLKGSRGIALEQLIEHL